MAAIRTPLTQPGRTPSKALPPQTPGRIPGQPDMGMPQDSVSGSTAQAGELWVPTARSSQFRLVIGRRLADGSQPGNIEWLRAHDHPNDSTTLQPIARITDSFGIQLQSFAHADASADRRNAKLVVFAGDTGDTNSLGRMEFSAHHDDATTHTLRAKVLSIAGAKKGFSLEGFISAPDFIKVGTVSVTLNAEATKDENVDFPEAMANAPVVLLTKANNFTGQLDVRLTSAPATGGFGVTVYTHDGSNATATVTVHWAAVCSSAYAA